LPGCGGGISFLFTQVAMIRMDELEQEPNTKGRSNAKIATLNFVMRKGYILKIQETVITGKYSYVCNLRKCFGFKP
jgi:hypothetical protein